MLWGELLTRLDGRWYMSFVFAHYPDHTFFERLIVIVVMRPHRGVLLHTEQRGLSVGRSVTVVNPAKNS